MNTITQIECPLCKGKNTEIRVESMEVYHSERSLVRCLNCGSSFIFPFVTDKEEKQFYKASAFFGGAPTPFGFWIRKRTVRKRISYVSAFLQRNQINPSKVFFVDIGAGIGLHTWMAQKAGYSKPLALEPRTEIAAWAREHYCIDILDQALDERIIKKIIEKQAERKWVLFFISHVLEHIADPGNFFSIIRSIKREIPTSYFFFEVPEQSCEIHILADYTYVNSFDQHLTFFTVDGFSELTTVNGLRLDQIDVKTNHLRFFARTLNMRFTLAQKHVLRIILKPLKLFLDFMGRFFGGDCYTDLPRVIRAIIS